MSYVIVQEPGTYNLSTEMKDIVLSTTLPTDIVLKINDTEILHEVYNPDTDDKIYITELGKLIENYLSGSGFDSAWHTALVCELTLDVLNDEEETELGAYKVLFCKAISNTEAEKFFTSDLFLRLTGTNKHTQIGSVEYLTACFEDSKTVQCFVTTSNFVNSVKRELYTATADEIKTLNVSFGTIAAKFPEIDPNTIIAYRIELGSEIVVYFVDRSNYLSPLQFRFTNYFDVPETIITRGNVIRKGINTFETARIQGIDVKYNSERADNFLVDSGKLFLNTDADRFREFFDSENVEVWFMNKWNKVIVKDESSEHSIRTGLSGTIQFSFYFADNRYNNTLTASKFLKWILENGTWNDDNVWIDSEHWIDS